MNNSPSAVGDNIGGLADDLAAMINAEIPRWAKLVKDLGIKADQRPWPALRLAYDL